VEVCVSEFGKLDGLIANAGIMHMAAPWEESEDCLRAIVEVNVLGVQFSVTHAMRAMVEAARGGSIVTIVSGAQFGIRGMSAYGATKGAVNAMTANWALEGANRGIRVNAVSPLGRTRMALEHSSARVALKHLEDLPTLPDPSIVAPVVVALLSDATAGITGQTIRFDGERLSAYQTSLTPLEERAGWSAEDIASALTKRFG
jgi:NAD(P)-dependent dehydrogenase (short-subunit alcohol dehydrogenase family)